MSGTIKEIDISELLNYFENPRHAIATTEEDTLKSCLNPSETNTC